MVLFKPTEKPVEPDLPVPPDVSIEIIVCPHCEEGNCEVWNSTEARMATCADCGTEFVPPVNESKSMRMIAVINENRRRAVLRAATAPTPSDELVRMLNR